jgi:hypothetical protein
MNKEVSSKEWEGKEGRRRNREVYITIIPCKYRPGFKPRTT